MRLRNDLKLRRIGSQAMVVGGNDGDAVLTDIYQFNDTAARLWEAVYNKDFEAVDLVRILQEEYGVEEAVATIDVTNLLEQWKECKLIQN